MNFLEPLTKVAATFRRKMQKLFGCVLIDRYITPAVLSLDLRPSAEFPVKCINSLAEIPKISS